MSRRSLAVLFVGIVLFVVGCGSPSQEAPKTAQAPQAGLPAEAMQIAQARGLTPDDITAALKTYVPSGKLDEYILFASGGHSGQVLVIGVPSMRLLKVIAVFTPEPWQGYGYGEKETMEVLANGSANGKPILWEIPTTRLSPRPTASTTGSFCSLTTKPTRGSPSLTCGILRPSRS
jgi:nitrous-oxide reductase